MVRKLSGSQKRGGWWMVIFEQARGSQLNLIYAFVEHFYGGKVAEDIVNASEYERHVNPNDDPFKGVWKAGA